MEPNTTLPQTNGTTVVETFVESSADSGDRSGRLDPELLAMKRLMAEFNKVPTMAARVRLLRYLNDRFAEDGIGGK